VPIDLTLVGVVDEINILPDDTFDYTLKPGKNRFS